MRWCTARRPKTWDKLARRREMPLAICAAPDGSGCPCSHSRGCRAGPYRPSGGVCYAHTSRCSQGQEGGGSSCRRQRPRGPHIADRLRHRSIAADAERGRDKRVRTGAAFALGQIAAPGKDIGKAQAELITALTKAVRDDKASIVREYCIKALRNFGPDAQEAIPILMARAKGTTGDRNIAFEILTQMGPVAVPALIEALKESRDRFRLDLMYCLEEIGPAAKEAVPLLRHRWSQTTLGSARPPSPLSCASPGSRKLRESR